MNENKNPENTVIYDFPLIGELTYREIHAFQDGFYCGIHKAREHEYGRQKHYWRIGWVFGDYYNRRFR